LAGKNPHPSGDSILLSHWQARFTAYLLGQDIRGNGGNDMGHVRRVYKTATRINE